MRVTIAAPRALRGLRGEFDPGDYLDHEAHNEVTFAAYYAGITFGRPFAARSAGLCPLCTCYIVRKRSTIVRLSDPVPLHQPNPTCVARGWFWAGNGRRFRTTETRQYAHWKCAQKSCYQEEQ